MRETIPFVLECLKGCVGSMLPRNHNNPHARRKPRAGATYQLTQATSHQIAHDSAPHTPGGDKAYPRECFDFGFPRNFRNTEDHEFPMHRNAMALEVLEFSRARQPGRFREPETHY